MIDRIELKTGHSYRVRWRDDRGKQRSKSFDRKKDAEAFEADIVLAKRAGTLEHLDRGKITLREFTRKWWTDYVETHLTAGTRKDYQRYLDQHVLPELGETPLNRIDPGTLQRLQAEMVAKPVGHEAIRTAMMMVQASFSGPSSGDI